MAKLLSILRHTIRNFSLPGGVVSRFYFQR